MRYWHLAYVSEENQSMDGWREALQNAMYPVLMRLLQEGCIPYPSS